MVQIAPEFELTETNNTFEPYKLGAFDEYLSYCALGGLITSDEGKISKMTLQQFCQQFGVDRKTCYRWRQIPGFGDKVRTRREQIFPLARETAVWNRLYLIGMQSQDLKAAVSAIKLFLGHFGDLRLPSRRAPEPKNQSDGLVELLMKAKEYERG